MDKSSKYDYLNTFSISTMDDDVKSKYDFKYVESKFSMTNDKTREITKRITDIFEQTDNKTIYLNMFVNSQRLYLECHGIINHFNKTYVMGNRVSVYLAYTYYNSQEYVYMPMDTATRKCNSVILKFVRK